MLTVTGLKSSLTSIKNGQHDWKCWENFMVHMLVIDLCFGVAIWGLLARFAVDETPSVVVVVERRHGGGDANLLSWSMRLYQFLGDGFWWNVFSSVISRLWIRVFLPSCDRFVC